MYDDHYGLTGRPFQLTPDPDFWFDAASHRKAMAYLGYGLSQGEGFVVITGAPGTGKTTLLGHLVETIDPERVNVIKIVTTRIEAEDLLHLVASGLGVDSQGMAKAALLQAIERGLHAVARDGKRTLLVVDEAQGLPEASLEELRMLSNFQAGGYALLQIFLLGQPEFRQALARPSLEQLRQRVIAMHHLAPLEAEEVEPYLIHRLSQVGWRGRPRFTNDAVAAIHHWSGGVPRRVNQLASRVLLFGAIEGIDSFSGRDVGDVIADLEADLAGADAPSIPAEAGPKAGPEADATQPQPLPLTPAPPSQPPLPMSRATPRATSDDGEEASALAAHVAQLEARIAEQDVALRRVLSLLVDWVEGDGRKPDIASIRDNAA